MATRKSRKIVRVTLPEQSEGRGIRGYILVATDDIEAVKKALAGKKLGVQGYDLSDGNFEALELSSLNGLRKGVYHKA